MNKISMKKMTQLASAVALASGFAAAPAMAVEFSANVTLATDYTFRGVSQTQETGAVQGGFDAAWDSGFYAGTWMSNVDYAGSTAVTEQDLYGGYVFDLGEDMSLDIGYIYYIYAGAEAGSNYQEFYAGLSVDGFGLSVIYSDDYFGEDNGEALILGVDYSLSLDDATSVDFHVGHTDATNRSISGSGTDFNSYVDYSVGLTHEVEGYAFGLTFVGTDASDDDELGEVADNRFIFSISKSM